MCDWDGALTSLTASYKIGHRSGSLNMKFQFIRIQNKTQRREKNDICFKHVIFAGYNNFAFPFYY